MGNAIGSMLGLAAAVAVSPLPAVAMILLLASPHGRVTGSMFGLGWVVGLAVDGTIMLVISGPASASTNDQPASWTGWLKLALGILLLLFGIRQWRNRPASGAEASTPKWMASIDTFSAGKSFGVGVLLSGVSPKNGALAIAAGTSIAATGESGAAQAVSLVLFVIIASVGVLAPLAVYFAGGDKAANTLDSWRRWFVAHNAAIMAVLFFVLGLKLVGDGLGVVG